MLETLRHITANPTWQHKLHGHDKKSFVAFEDFVSYIGGAAEYGATPASARHRPASHTRTRRKVITVILVKQM